MNLIFEGGFTVVSMGAGSVVKGGGSAARTASRQPLQINLQLFAEKTPLKVGDVGSYGELAARGVRGDKITPHHMPQAATGFTSYHEGGALALHESEHFLTRTFGGRGSVTLQNDAGLSFRQVLCKDIQDIRNITGSKYNNG